MRLFVFVLLVFFVLSLATFLTGIILAVFELSDVLPSVICTCLGLAGLFGSAGIWLTAPICQNRVATPKQEPKFVTIKFPGITKDKSKHQIPEQVQLITPDTTENLMKSIRGIPYLIQAIQYSLETTYYSNLLSEMGQIGNSVIHTAPGCTSVLDCDSDDEHNLTTNLTPTPRYSGPEEQWEAVETNRWSNPQLRLSMNRRTSSLLVSVFPYSESRPVEDPHLDSRISSRQESVVASERGSINDGVQESFNALGSQQSQISRVAVSHTSLPSREIRCIGMSPAVLNRFNSSFRATAAQKDV